MYITIKSDFEQLLHEQFTVYSELTLTHHFITLQSKVKKKKNFN